MIGQLTTVVFSAVISGAVSRFVTVAVLKVHISYLCEAIKDHGQRPRNPPRQTVSKRAKI